ncbi:hypothetical protein BOX15_Mlig022842g1 [Macrostomum lignano]|uniref:Palmitoyltransferase n=1 Tax=Macrostomum lignano TaxID=282301 RepID=A0A267FFN3_9PLAT|nr:hypothetical protein BOX15_Mlig022842g1 [Macrostomum lignano]
MPEPPWREYRGRSRIACGGRCVMARNMAIFYLTLGLIIICSALFFAFDCRLLAASLSPAVPAAAAVQFVFVLCCLFRTTCSDPGIVPRGTPEEAAWIEEEIEPPKAEPHGAYRPQPRLKDVVIGGRVFKLKYCYTCKLWRPPRASHCSSCDNCVDRFDHHCPWVGNCVGRRNYRYFFMFLASLSVYCVYIMVFSIANIAILAKAKDNLFDALKESPASILVALVAFFSIWSVMGLAGFHVLLMCREVSTNEDIKGVFNKKRNPDCINPFDRGDGCANCCYVLFGPTQPSLLNVRPWRDDENNSDGEPYADGVGAGVISNTDGGEFDDQEDNGARELSSAEGLLSNGAGAGGGRRRGEPQYGSTETASVAQAEELPIGQVRITKSERSDSRPVNWESPEL